jgi:hypothetical protein
MVKTSSEQKKKKIRKLINRTKNRLQRVRKFCRQHVAPVMLATAIIGGVIFGTYLRATATGVEELYYTYWDLVSSIFAAEGYDMSIKNGNDKISTPDRVTGRQLWNNIKKWVKIKCGDAKTLYDEFTLLPKAVTAEGIKMSKDLYDLMGDFCAEYTAYSSTTSDGNFFDCSSKEAIKKEVYSLMGCSDMGNLSYLDSYISAIYNGALLNIYVRSDGSLCLFTGDRNIYMRESDYNPAIPNSAVCFYYKNSDGRDELFKTQQVWNFVGYDSLYDMGYSLLSDRYNGGAWIVKHGKLYGDIFDKIKDPVDLKNAPDYPSAPGKNWDWSDDNTATFPWWYYPNWLEDSMRRQSVTDEKMPDGDPDDGDDNKDKNGKSWKDIIPALIPWVPTVVNPTETEKDSEKGTENVAPGGKPKPGTTEKPDSTQKDTEKDSESDSEKATDPGDISPIAERAGNWKRLFPFCIPWDMMSLIKSMKADKKAPIFEFKYTFKAVNYTWVIKVDMSDYWKYIKIFRWGMTIFFIIGLFFLTVKFTTFVYKMGS